tara:strand:- start:18757 stop:19449 length:693 start_codon:yes stop_codon:yes gene_type:complete
MSTPTLGMKLYSYFRSSCSYRVRIALYHKGLDFSYVPVHLVKDGGQQHAETYKQRNSMGQVPTLELIDNDGSISATLTQSVAILEYLEEVYPDPPLLPKDSIERAKVRQIVEIVNSGIQPIQNLHVMQKISSSFDVEMAEAKKWAAFWVAHGFRGLEPVLAQTSGQFAFGDQVTLADAFIVPQHYNAKRFGIDMTPFPNIAKVVDNALSLDAFQRARPEVQPDTPDDLRL